MRELLPPARKMAPSEGIEASVLIPRKVGLFGEHLIPIHQILSDQGGWEAPLFEPEPPFIENEQLAPDFQLLPLRHAGEIVQFLLHGVEVASRLGG